MTTPKAVTYSSYLRLPELLSLQEARSEGPEHDELLFIVIHQVYELWFKEILHEVDHLRGVLARGETGRALHTFKRILTVLKTLVAQIDVLETMTPLAFLSFRDRLESASGFESFQFRELEFALGHKAERVLRRFPESSPERRRLEARLREPTLWDAFLAFLATAGHPIPKPALERDPTAPIQPDERVQAALVEIYRGDDAHTQLCERLLDVDEGLQEWRYRHVQMVRRTIGTKGGTGGSSGAEYLQGALFRPLFPDLWAIRTEL